jgi:hypothetical protein
MDRANNNEIVANTCGRDYALAYPEDQEISSHADDYELTWQALYSSITDKLPQ